MITIHLNNQCVTVKNNCLLIEVLNLHGMNASTFSVAVNRNFIPRQKHSSTYLQDGDVIETIRPMQGG